MASRDLVVRVLGDSTSVERAMGRSSAAVKQFDNTATRSLSRVDDSFAKLNRVRTGAFLGGAAATAVLAGIKRTTDAASDLNEEISKSRQVFGQSSGAIEEWSKTTAKSIGISRTAALQATGTFGGLFDVVGVESAKAAALSKQFVQLAADMSSFNNADPTEVLLALRSGLSGESEPLRRFQVFLTEAATAQEALAQSGKSSVKELTNMDKVLARVNLIMAQTVKQQGDVSRTSESLANQQRILAANVADLEANLGRLLLPAMTKVTAALAEGTDAAIAFADALSTIGDVDIPSIEIPIVGKEVPGTGSTVGETVANIIEDALDPRKIAARINPAGNIGLTLNSLGLLGGLFDSDTMKGEVDAAAQAAIDEAFSGFKFPKPRAVNPAGFGRQAGVDFGHAESITGALDAILKGSRKAISDATKDVKAGLGEKALEVALGKRSDAFGKLIDALQLRVDRAGLTAGLQNDLAALLDLKAGLQKQIKAGVDVASAQSRMVGVVNEIATTREAIAQGVQDIAQARQFRALGLSATGDEIIPGIKNLQTRINSALKQIGSGDLDVSSKLEQRLKLARNLIKREGKALTDETRRTINDLIKTVTGGRDKMDRTQGPLTAKTSLNANKFLENVTGLNRDQIKQIRSNLSGFNSAGLALARPSRTPGGFVGGTGIPVVESHVTVELDGQVVGRSVTRSQVKTSRGTKQKRGPNRRSGI